MTQDEYSDFAIKFQYLRFEVIDRLQKIAKLFLKSNVDYEVYKNKPLLLDKKNREQSKIDILILEFLKLEELKLIDKIINQTLNKIDITLFNEIAVEIKFTDDQDHIYPIVLFSEIAFLTDFEFKKYLVKIEKRLKTYKKKLDIKELKNNEKSA